MDRDKDFPFSDNHESGDDEMGSDELLSDDNLRLPESANILVRLHAVQAWLSRRYDEATIEVGEAAGWKELHGGRVELVSHADLEIP